MSAPQGVDVLAKLDWAAEQVRAGAVRASDAEQRRVDEGIREARAAVAELVSAARDYADVIENAYDCTQTTPARIRLRAALSRIGSAK